MNPIAAFLGGLVLGGMVGLVVIGLLMMANDRLRVVGRWKGRLGTELIDTSDGRRWCEFGPASGHPIHGVVAADGFDREFVRMLS